MRELFEAVNYCHELGIIHRDVEPKNILILNDQSVRLIDFGVNKSSKKGNLHAIVGTPYYMAPEVLEGT